MSKVRRHTGATPRGPWAPHCESQDAEGRTPHLLHLPIGAPSENRESSAGPGAGGRSRGGCSGPSARPRGPSVPGLGERPLSGSPPLPGPPASGAQSRLPRPYRAAPQNTACAPSPVSPAAPPARHPRPGSPSLPCGSAAPRERWHLAGAERGSPRPSNAGHRTHAVVMETQAGREPAGAKPRGGRAAAEGVVRLRTGLLRPDASELGFRRRVCMALGDADTEALGCSGQGARVCRSPEGRDALGGRLWGPGVLVQRPRCQESRVLSVVCFAVCGRQAWLRMTTALLSHRHTNPIVGRRGLSFCPKEAFLPEAPFSCCQDPVQVALTCTSRHRAAVTT